MCNAVGAEPETWGRDLPVTGPSAVPQGCPGEPRAAVQAAWREEKPESPVEPEVTQGPLPASCQASTISPSAFTGSCACRAAGGETSPRLCSCGLLVCGRGGGRGTGWHFWRFPADWVHPCSLPWCLLGKCSVWPGSLSVRGVSAQQRRASGFWVQSSR